MKKSAEFEMTQTFNISYRMYSRKNGALLSSGTYQSKAVGTPTAKEAGKLVKAHLKGGRFTAQLNHVRMCIDGVELVEHKNAPRPAVKLIANTGQGVTVDVATRAPAVGGMTGKLLAVQYKYGETAGKPRPYAGKRKAAPAPRRTLNIAPDVRIDPRRAVIPLFNGCPECKAVQWHTPECSHHRREDMVFNP